VLARHPGTRFLVLGRGDGDEALRGLDGAGGAAVELLGPLGDAEKASLLRSVDVYVAPHTGGESFGIVLVEAMSAGRRCSRATSARSGGCWTTARSACCSRRRRAGARVVARRAARRPRRARAAVASASGAVRRYDWSRVARRGARRVRDGASGADRVGEDVGPGGC
jgi:phosphatidylinositol alpha-mannosyltransferase